MLQVRWLHSFTPVTYLCKLLGINEGQPWAGQIRPDEFVAHLPRYSASGLAPTGPAQALFKTSNRFVLQHELFG